MYFAKNNILFILSISIISLFGSVSFAADAQIKPINASDQQWINTQIQSIDTLSKQHLKRSLSNDLQNNLEILQLLLDKNVIKKEQTTQLQAMGVVLGDLYLKELGVHWVSYEDAKGRSRGLQWIDSERVFFPVTKISRLVQAGMKVNTQQVYDKGLKVIHAAIKENNRKKMLKLK